MGILLKKVYRDLRYNKGRTLSVILIIAISMALYGGLLLAYENADATFSETENRLDIETVRFSTGYINPAQIDLSTIEGIQAWDFRLSLITGMDIPGEETTYTAPLYGIPGNRHPRVNDFDVLEGQYLSTYDNPRLMLIKQFVNGHNLGIGDNVSIHTIGEQGKSVTTEVTIGGSVFSAEYVYNVNPKTGLPDISGLAAGWLPLEYAQNLFQTGNTVNEVLVRMDDAVRHDPEQRTSVINAITAELTQLTPQVSHTLLEDEPEQKMKNADLGALDEMARVFGIVILILALFAIYDNISKLIASQRNYIGTMRALGGSKRTVTIHYTSMSVILGLLGILIGIPLGWLTGAAMIIEYADLLGIPTPSTAFHVGPFIEAVSITFTLSILSGLVSALAAARINPREAMSSAYISMVFQAKPLFERIMSKLPGFRSVSASIPLRTLFRNKRKTAITILTYSISLILIIAALGFMDSFNYSLDRNYEEFERYDMQVYFNPSNPIPTSTALQKINAIAGILSTEVFVSQQIELEHGGTAQSVNLYGFQLNSTLRKFNLNPSGSRSGLVLGKTLANDLGVQRGDELSVLNMTYTVTGISSEVIAEGAYLPLAESQQLFSMGQNVSGVLLSLQDNVDETDIKQSIQTSGLPVGVIISTSEVKQSIETLIQGVMSMIYIMIFIGFVTVALFSFNTIVLEVISRENEFVNLRSLGASRWKIAKIIIIQGLLIALVGSVVTIPLSYFVTDWVIQSMVEDLMVIPTIINPITYLSAIGAAMLATFAGIIAGFRHVINLDLVDKLRTRVSN